MLHMKERNRQAPIYFHILAVTALAITFPLLIKKPRKRRI